MFSSESYSFLIKIYWHWLRWKMRHFWLCICFFFNVIGRTMHLSDLRMSQVSISYCFNQRSGRPIFSTLSQTPLERSWKPRRIMGVGMEVALPPPGGFRISRIVLALAKWYQYWHLFNSQHAHCNYSHGNTLIIFSMASLVISAIHYLLPSSGLIRSSRRSLRTSSRRTEMPAWRWVWCSTIPSCAPTRSETASARYARTRERWLSGINDLFGLGMLAW